MNMLLANVTLIIGIIILILAIAAGVTVAVLIRKKQANSSGKIDWTKYNANGQLKKHIPVLWPKEVEFFQIFRSVLPAGFLVVPKMGVDEIVKPNGNLLLFNAIKSKHVDFCVIKLSNMEPVAVLDTFYPSITDSTIQEMDIDIVKALEATNIPVIKYEILDVPYDRDAMLKTFLDAIDPVSLAQLRNKKDK